MEKFLITAENQSRSNLLKKNIMQSLLTNGDSTISDISKDVNLSVPTVTKLIDEMMEANYILDYGKQDTSGGRKPNIYGLNPESGYFIGIDVLRDHINIAAVDFKGSCIRSEMGIPYILENTETAMQRLCTMINKFITILRIPRENILAAGVNIAGRVNPHSGFSYSFLYLKERPLSELIEEKIKIKTYIENDTRAMTYGEYMQGVVKGEKNIIFVNMTWGLGIGIIIDGKLYYGHSGFSGEFGHFPAYDNEIICYCGKKGCFETEASGSAIARMLVQSCKNGSNSILKKKIEKKEQLSLYDLINAIKNEDVLCIELLEKVGTKLGKGIAGLINIFNPELIILGGALSETGEYLSLPVKATIRKHSLNLVSQDTEIKISKLGEKAGVIGACLLSRSKILGIIQF